MFQIHSLPNQKGCMITVSGDTFRIEGNYYCMYNQEVKRIVSKYDECNVKEFLGLGKLQLRSHKKMLQFLMLGCGTQIVVAFLKKLDKFLINADMSCISTLSNVLTLICFFMIIRYFFSKKKLIEISFLSKRFCVDEKVFSGEDIMKLNETLLNLR